MSFGWKRYVDDYEEGKDGKYVYVGKYYRFFLEKEQLRRFRRAYAILAGAVVLFFLLAGLSEYASSRTWYVVLPYAACIFPIAFLVMDTVRICRAPERMSRKQYNGSVVQHKWACIFLLILSLWAVIGDAVFLLAVCPPFLRAQELIFLVFCVALALLAGLWIFLGARLPAGAEGSRK